MTSDYLKLCYFDEDKSAENNERPLFGDRIFPFSRSEVYFAEAQESTILTKGDDVKRAYRLRLDPKTTIKEEFLPGDTIGIIPQNDPFLVDQILFRLNATKLADTQCILKISETTKKKNPTLPKHIPEKTTLRQIFLNNVDILKPPKKIFLKSLLQFTSAPEEAAKLKHICSIKGSQDYTNLITTTCRTLFGLLDTFPSCKPPIEIILEHLPPLQPRPYSISSYTGLEVTFFVLQKSDGTTGLCTGWLEDLIITPKSGVLVPFYFRQSNSFRLLQDYLKTEIILIASGSGIAPFRSFLQYLSKEHNFGSVWLFYGCRYKDRDFLYKDDIDKFLSSGVLKRFNLALSRENNGEKYYVQDKIKANTEEVIAWIDKGARIFVCGDAKTMLKDVKQCFIDILSVKRQIPIDDARECFKEMEKNNIFLVDNWC